MIKKIPCFLMLFSTAFCLLLSPVTQAQEVKVLSSSDPIVIGYTSSKSFFADANVQAYLKKYSNAKLIFREYTSRCDLLTALQTGKIDLFYGTLSEMYAIQANKLDYQPLLKTLSGPRDSNQVSDTYNFALLSYDPKIESLYSLKNQTVAFSDTLSMSGSILPRYVLSALGVGFQPLALVSSDAAMQALKSDKAKAAATWWPSSATQPKQGRILFELREIPNPVVFVKSSFLQDRTDRYALIAALMSFPSSVYESNYPLSFTLFANEDEYQAWISRLQSMGVLKNPLSQQSGLCTVN